jgi:hypothetical protein
VQTLPLYAEELVEELSKTFPPRCITPGQSLEDAHRYAGKRELVEFLLTVAQKTNPRTASR